MISYPAPLLCQGADEDAMMQVGSIMFPGRISRHPGENGLRIWAEGDPKDINTGVRALGYFQVALGVLRAWKSGAGMLADEQRKGLASGPVRDELGNQYILLGGVVTYNFPDEVAPLANSARRGIEASVSVRNSLWLNGRQGRTAADFYMIHEYAQRDLGGTKGIAAKLGLSESSQRRLTSAANNLSPLEGGRHATGQIEAAMTLDEQAAYVGRLIRSWISLF